MALSVTGATIVNNALTAIGILEQGGTPSTSDQTDALYELNAMWDDWGIDEGLIYAELPVTQALTANKSPYKIGQGSGADINVQAPQRIYQATIELTAGSAKFRRELKIVEAGDYFAHGDLAAAAQAADELYPDYNVDSVGNAALYLFPVPICTVTTSLELIVAAPFVQWTANGAYILPYGYTDAIQYALACRLLPRFGVAVQPQVAQLVMQLAEKAEIRIRNMNAKNRQLTPEMANLPSLSDVTASKMDKAKAQLPPME